MIPRTSTAADTQPSATLFRDPTLRKKKSQTEFFETLSCFFQAVESTCIQGSLCSELSILAPCPLLGQPAHLDIKVLVTYKDSLLLLDRNMQRFACMRKCLLFVTLSHIVSHAGVTLSSRFSHHSWLNGTIICVNKFDCYHAVVLPQMKNTLWMFTVLSTSWVMVLLQLYQFCLSVKWHCRSWWGYM